MLISELIKKLDYFKEQYGDLKVFHWDDWDFFEVTNVQFYENEILGIGGSPIDIHGTSPRWNEEI